MPAAVPGSTRNKSVNASASQKYLPRRLAEALNRALGGDAAFTDDIDADQRQRYEDRARHS